MEAQNIDAVNSSRADLVIEPKELFCPKCNTQHIDEGEWKTKPHRTHQCQSCLHEWKPFDYCTVGVSKTPVVKKWLFHVDHLEYYVYCSDCFFNAGDQFTGFSGDDLSREEKLSAGKEAGEHFRSATKCEQCQKPLTQSYPALDSNCPMQDDCSKVKGNTHWYYPGDCKNWEECNAVYSACRSYANDSEIEDYDW